jgi:hypothetical protein
MEIGWKRVPQEVILLNGSLKLTLVSIRMGDHLVNRVLLPFPDPTVRGWGRSIGVAGSLSLNGEGKTRVTKNLKSTLYSAIETT